MYSKATKDILIRPKLFSRIEENISKKLISVIAPAGYGKSTLIKSYLIHSQTDYIWVNISKHNTSYFYFLEAIVNGLNDLIPGFGSNISVLINSAKSSPDLIEKSDILLFDLISTVSSEIKKYFNKRIVIVIDDLHNLAKENGWIQKIFDILFDLQPSTLTIITTSRSSDIINTENLLAKRDLFIINTTELEFSINEIKLLIDMVYPDASDKSIPEQLYKILGGWITGIHLAIQSGINFQSEMNFIKQNVNEFLYSFFLQEIWNSLDAEVQDFLLKTSLLENFSPKLCDEIFGFKKSKLIIDGLIKKNIFILKSSLSESRVNPAIYNYHENFRTFLLSKLTDIIDDTGVSSYYSAIAGYFEKTNNYVNAVEYYIKAGNFSQAAEIIRINFKDSYDLQQFERWLQCFPEDFVLASPLMLYIKAQIELYNHKNSIECIDNINKALKLAKDDYFDLIFVRAEALILSQNYSPVINEFDHLLKTEKDNRILLKVNYILGKLYYNSHSDDKSKDFLENAYKLSLESDNFSLLGEISRLLGNIYFKFGNVEKAFFYKNKSIEYNKNIYVIVNTYLNYTTMLTQLTKFAEAYNCLSEMENLYVKYPFSAIYRLLLKAKFSFYYECTDFDEGIKAYDELINIENKMKLTGYMYSSYLFKGLQYHYKGDTKFALENYDIAEEHINSDNKVALLLINQARALAFLYEDGIKNKSFIELHLNNINSYYIENKIIPGNAQVSFYLTSLYLKNGEIHTALKYMEDAFRLSGERHMLSFFEREIFMFRHVFDLALSRNLFKPLIGQIYEAIKEKQTFHWLSPEFHTRLKRDIEKLTDLRLLSFGNAELYLRGEIICDEKWIRKKSKIMLTYLLANESTVLTKDKAIDMFFPELTADKAEVALHSTIYNIRTAVKIYDIPKGKKGDDKVSPLRGENRGGLDYNPQYIIYEDKMLRLNKDFYYSADNVQFDKLYHRVKLPSLEKDEKIKLYSETLKLYKGEFLPGYYESWCEEKRIAYKNMFIDMCEGLIALLEEEKRYDEAVKYASLLIAEDNINEKGYLCIIASYAAMGNINMARDRFQLMMKTFDEELGEKPSAKTLNKIKDLL